MPIQVFWVVTPCDLVSGKQHFEKILKSSILKTEVIHSFEMLVLVQKKTHYNPKDHNNNVNFMASVSTCLVCVLILFSTDAAKSRDCNRLKEKKDEIKDRTHTIVYK